MALGEQGYEVKPIASSFLSGMVVAVGTVAGRLTAEAVNGISFVDLYRTYPRFDINVDAEQARLLEHDVILFQFPVFWYSTPALIN